MSRILKFDAENFLRLKVVQITPDGRIVRITGRNGAGKSSVLSAIEGALAGADHLPAKPIHRGQTGGRIRLELGDRETELIVTRRFTEKDSTLIIEAPSGARFPSPQRMLNEMLGAISFDPLAFTRMKPAAQYETLRQLVDIDVDIDALDGQAKTAFETRTEVNRDAARLRAQASGIVYPAETPAQHVDITSLSQQLREAAEHNTAVERHRSEQARLAGRITEIAAAEQAAKDALPVQIGAVRQTATERIAGIDRQIAELQRQRSEIEAGADAAVEAARRSTEEECRRLAAEAEGLRRSLEAEGPGDPVDLEAISARISAAQQTNGLVELRLRRETLEAEATALEKRSEELTTAIAARQEERRAAIARASMPVPGLGFGDGEVLYDALPLQQASHAEQIRISAAVAMAANPKIRVMLIRDGSLLDQDSMAVLAEMVEKNDYQLWLEAVAEDRGVGIYLEDGSIAAEAPPTETPHREAEPPKEPRGTLL